MTFTAKLADRLPSLFVTIVNRNTFLAVAAAHFFEGYETGASCKECVVLAHADAFAGVELGCRAAAR